MNSQDNKQQDASRWKKIHVIPEGEQVEIQKNEENKNNKDIRLSGKKEETVKNRQYEENAPDNNNQTQSPKKTDEQTSEIKEKKLLEENKQKIENLAKMYNKALFHAKGYFRNRITEKKNEDNNN